VRKSKKKLRRPWRAEWNASAAGSKVEGLRRRGKWILVDLAGGPVLRAHMGMSGQFTVVPATEPAPDHLHVVFELDNGKELRLRDPRRFGAAEYFPDRDAVEARMDTELGPEPFALDPNEFRAAITSTARTLKAILLDQTVVAGVGNIYADEALFRAKLHPARKGKSLKPEECDRLREAIATVMTAAIESRGSTIRDYVGGSGLRGGFQNEFAVYGRTGDPCPACRTPIASVRLAGRGSHFCPACQPKRISSGVRSRGSGVRTGRRPGLS
jgi:formamidopyrimidine-DNA glycosylase